MRPFLNPCALVLIIGAALIGCSQPERQVAPAPAEAPVATAVGRDAIYAAAAEGPEPFVRALYAPFVAGQPRGETPAPGQDPIYSRMLNATIGADVRVAKGEVPTLNYDLICGCQDQGVFTLDSLVVTQTDPNTAAAAVVFTNAGETTSQTLKLVREGPNWKVDDVVRADGASIREETVKVIAAAGG